MLCEICKIREANIIYTEVIGGVKTEHHYCAQCAKELDFGPYSAIFDTDLPVGRFLSGLMSPAGSDNNDESETPQIVCPTCGTTYQEFINSSTFGCQDCYGVFDLLIADRIKQLQGSDSHKGKKPARFSKIAPASQLLMSDSDNPMMLSLGERINACQARLNDALRKEDYETAAQCRDEIKRLKEEEAEP